MAGHEAGVANDPSPALVVFCEDGSHPLGPQTRGPQPLALQKPAQLGISQGLCGRIAEPRSQVRGQAGWREQRIPGRGIEAAVFPAAYARPP